MSTFVQYLNEAEMPKENIVDIIQRDCSKWLKEAEETILYRGDKTLASKPYGLNQTLPNRRPLDSSPLAHQLFDQYFLKHYGHRYRSDHVAFGVPDMEVAEQYGRPGIILPIGDYSYIWSSRLPDLYKGFNLKKLANEHELMLWHKLNRELKIGEIPNSEELKVCADLVNRFFIENNIKYSSTNISHNTHSEVMIHCKSYYLVNVYSDLANNFMI